MVGEPGVEVEPECGDEVAGDGEQVCFDGGVAEAPDDLGEEGRCGGLCRAVCKCEDGDCGGMVG